MKKYKFSQSERFAIWSHHGRACYWCEEPLTLQETTIDHVIPENLLEKPAELTAVLEKFSLPKDFRINDFGNWLPAHDKCNKSKNGKALRLTQMTLGIIDKLQKEAEAVRRKEQKIKTDARKSDALGRIFAAKEAGTITKDDIMQVFDILPSDGKDYKALYDARIYLDRNRWKVVELVGASQAIVTNGRLAGITPAGDNPHNSWQCPNCSNYGPWNGIICLSCGMRSDPSD